MRILSVSFHNIAPFGDRIFDFRSSENGGSVFSAVLSGSEENAGRLLHHLKLLFGLADAAEDCRALLAVPEERGSIEARLKEADEEFVLSFTVDPQPEALIPLVQHQLRNSRDTVLHSEIKGIQRELFRRNDFLADLIDLSLSFSSSALAGLFSPDPEKVQNVIRSYRTHFGTLELPAIVNHLLSDEEGRRDELKKQLESLSILHDGAEELSRSELDAQRQKLDGARVRLAETKDAIDWSNRLLYLREEVAKILKEEHELGVETDRFAMKKPVLENALRALALAPYYETIKAQNDSIAVLKKKQSDLSRTLPILRERARNSQSLLDAAETQRKAVADKLQKDGTVIAQVREIESQIAQLRSELEDKSREAEEQQSRISSFLEEINKTKNRISDASVRQRNLLKKMADQNCDDALSENLAGYKHQLLLIDSSQIQIDKVINEQKEIQREIEANKGFLNEINGELSKLKKEEGLTRTEYLLREKEAAKLLGTENEDTLRSNLANILKRIDLIHLLSEKTNELLALNQRIDEDKKNLDKTLFALKLASLKHKSASQTLNDKQAVVAAVQEVLDFQKEIMKYEEERRHLANGKPCPLCGAVHHPFSASLTIDSKAQQRFEAASLEADAAKQAYDAAALEEKKASDDYEEAQLRIDELVRKAAELTQFLIQTSLEADIQGLKGRKPSTWPTLIRQRLSLTQTHLADSRGKLEKLDGIKEQIVQIRGELESLLERISIAKEQSEKTAGDVEQEEKGLQRAISDEAQARTQRDELVRTLERVFQKYGLNSTTLSQLKQSFLILEKRNIAWQSSKEEAARLAEEISRDQAELETLSADYDRESQVLTSLSAESNAVNEKIRALSKDRSDLFGSQQTEEEEIKLEQLEKNAEEAFDYAWDVNDQRQQQLHGAEQELTNIEAGIEKEILTLTRHQEEFAAQLSANGFKSESAFLAARITDSQREALQAQANILSDRERSIIERKTAKLDELQKEEALQKTHKGRSELDSEIVSLKSLIADAEKSIAALEEKLDRNQKTKAVFNRIKEQKDRSQRLVDHLEALRAASKAARTEGERDAVFLTSLARLINVELKEFSSRFSISVPTAQPRLQVCDEGNSDSAFDFAALPEEDRLLLAALAAQACISIVPGAFEFFPLFIRVPQGSAAPLAEGFTGSSDSARFALLS
jgi:exonuclease SbcC